MIIYILMGAHEHENPIPLGVYSSIKLAKKALKKREKYDYTSKYPKYEVCEFSVDAPATENLITVKIGNPSK